MLQGAACGVHRSVDLWRSLAGRRWCQRRFPGSTTGRALPTCWRPGAIRTCCMRICVHRLLPALAAAFMACLLYLGAVIDSISLLVARS